MCITLGQQNVVLCATHTHLSGPGQHQNTSQKQCADCQSCLMLDAVPSLQRQAIDHTRRPGKGPPACALFTSSLPSCRSRAASLRLAGMSRADLETEREAQERGLSLALGLSRGALRAPVQKQPFSLPRLPTDSVSRHQRATLAPGQASPAPGAASNPFRQWVAAPNGGVDPYGSTAQPLSARQPAEGLPGVSSADAQGHEGAPWGIQMATERRPSTEHREAAVSRLIARKLQQQLEERHRQEYAAAQAAASGGLAPQASQWQKHRQQQQQVELDRQLLGVEQGTDKDQLFQEAGRQQARPVHRWSLWASTVSSLMQHDRGLPATSLSGQAVMSLHTCSCSLLRQGVAQLSTCRGRMTRSQLGSPQAGTRCKGGELPRPHLCQALLYGP